MDLVQNNLQMLICYKTQQTKLNHTAEQQWYYSNDIWEGTEVHDYHKSICPKVIFLAHFAVATFRLIHFQMLWIPLS